MAFPPENKYRHTGSQKPILVPIKKELIARYVISVHLSRITARDNEVECFDLTGNDTSFFGYLPFWDLSDGANTLHTIGLIPISPSNTNTQAGWVVQSMW